MSKEIYLDAPNVGKSEKEYLNQAIDAGYVSTAGPFVPEFEKKFAEYLGVENAVSTQSGTAALHMVLYELGIGEGDEVIVPALTFVATINPVFYVGATPVFVDVSDKTWTIEPGEVKRLITPKTKAIIAVHLYGNPCGMEALAAVADEYGLYLIEDATESLGAVYNDKQTGTLGDFGCFSFNGNKLITTGGGGMVVGRDIEKLEHIKFLANQAKHPDKTYYHPEIGFNYRMTNIEAALGLAQMESMEDFLAKRRQINGIYREELADVDDLGFQEECAGAKSSCWLTCLVFEKDIDISRLEEQLKKKGICTRRVFVPVVEFPPYQIYSQGSYKNSFRIFERGLCLPSSTLNSEYDIHYVCEVIRELM